MPKQANKSTIYDIAKLAGVSAATVSLALRDDKRISKKTKDIISTYAAEIGYNPNYFARGLKEKRTYNIGVIVPDFKNPVFSEIVNGIESFLISRDYHINIGVTNMDLSKEEYYLNSINNQRVDGIIFLPTFIQELAPKLRQFEKNRFPFVLAGVTCEDFNLNTVNSNMIEGAFIGVEHLIKKGHKNIAFISGESSPVQSFERIKGYQKALSIYGIDLKEEYIVKASQRIPDIRRAVTDFLSKHSEVTAIFCLCDFVAMAAMKAIWDLNLKIPNDIAVMGYDNIYLAEYYQPGLSSIDSQNKKIGEMAARMALNLIEGKQSEVEHILLAPSLVVRDST